MSYVFILGFSCFLVFLSIVLFKKSKLIALGFAFPSLGGKEGYITVNGLWREHISAILCATGSGDYGWCVTNSPDEASCAGQPTL